MWFKIWLILPYLMIMFGFNESSNYLRPDVLTYNTKEPNWKRPPHDRIVMCTINSWREYTSEAKTLNLNLTQCTHAVYRTIQYASIDRLDNWKIGQGDAEYDDHAIKTVVNFRKSFPHLRVLVQISVNGMASNYMFSNYKDRLVMTKTAIDFMNKYKFDGIVILYTIPRSLPDDYLKRSDDIFDLIKIMCHELWKREYTLTLRLFNYRHRILIAFKLRRFIEYVDFFEIHMGDTNNKIKSYFPLYCLDKDDEYCLDYQIRTLILLDIPMNRVLISLRTGAFSYITRNERTIRIGVSSPTRNPQNLCTELKGKQTYVFYWDGLGHCPYVHSYYHRRVYVYETPRSLIEKIRFVMKFNVRGFFLPMINFEDLNRECPNDMHTGKYQDIEYDFEDLKTNVNIAKALPLLNLPNEETLKSRHREWPQMYIKNNKSLNLFIPKNERMNQPLLHSITTGIVYAQQELAVQEALRKKKQAQGSRMLWRDEVWQIFSKEY